MKIGLITLHAVRNFGSVLQTYATVEILRRMGHDVSLINYIRKRDRTRALLYAVVKDSQKNLPQKILSIGYKSVETPIWKRNFSDFLNDHLKLTRSYYTNRDLKGDLPIMDAYITGSDQVWNSTYNQGIDRAYFLDFAPGSKRKISYAASFGFDSLDPSEKSETKRLLQRYNAIAVREKQGLKILEDLGIHNAAHVLDPTLLLDSIDWTKIAAPIDNEPPYLVFYSVEWKETSTAFKYAQQIAQARNLKIYQVVFGGKRQGVAACDKLFTFKRPEFFLSLMLGADYVVATSFHGTAFSINFGKQFVSVLPNQFQGRAAGLLKLLGLEGRGVSSKHVELEKALATIDYTDVNAKLDRERVASLQYLKTALKE